MTKMLINKNIKHLGLEIVGTRGDGYFYFLDTTTSEQVGNSVNVCYLNQMSLDKWVKAAEFARANPEGYTIGTLI